MVMGVDKNLLFGGAVGHGSLKFLQLGIVRRESINCDSVRTFETISMFSVDAASPLASTNIHRDHRPPLPVNGGRTVELRLHSSIHDAGYLRLTTTVEDGEKHEAISEWFFFFLLLKNWRAENRAVEFPRPCLIPYSPVMECLTSGGSRAGNGRLRE